MREISIERCTDDGGFLCGFFAKGDHDDDAFRAAVLKFQEHDVSGLPVQRDWWRFVPRRDGEPGMDITHAEPRTRGAFLVTTVWMDS